MSPQDMRRILIERTISVIANEGLDKTTTKAITAGTGINEAYIYRNFANKDELLTKAFDKLDEELIGAVLQHLPVMYLQALEFDLRSRAFFDAVWKFLLANRAHCLAFVRYYYSPYFIKYSAEKHKNRYKTVVEQFKPAFKDEADVWMILNHILNVMLDFAVKVHNGHMPGSEDYAEHVFRVIYISVKHYFRIPEEGNLKV